MSDLDLNLYLKDSLDKSGDEHFFLKEGKKIETQIAKILDDKSFLKANAYFILNDSDDEVESNGLVFSLISRASSNANINIKYSKTLTAKANAKFKKTNVTAKIINHSDYIYITSSVFMGYERLKDEYSTLIYANDSYDFWGDDEESKKLVYRDKEVKKFIEEYIDSTILDMKIALLGTSLFLDEAILNDILSKEDE